MFLWVVPALLTRTSSFPKLLSRQRNHLSDLGALGYIDVCGHSIAACCFDFRRDSFRLLSTDIGHQDLRA